MPRGKYFALHKLNQLYSRFEMEEVFRRYRYLAEHIFENVTEENLVNTYQNKTQTVNSTIMDNSEQIKYYKDFLTNYNKLSELCFNDCISDFSTEKIWKGEKNCTLKCAEKHFKGSHEILTKFMEQVSNIGRPKSS